MDPISGLYAYGAAALLLPGALLISPQALSHLWLASFFLPLILVADTYCWLCGLGALPVIHAAWAVDLLLWRNPRDDFMVLSGKEVGLRKKDDGREDGEMLMKENYPASLWDRVWWVTKVVSSLRFIGVQTDTKRANSQEIAPSNSVSRMAWLFWKAGIAALCILTLDGTTSYSFYDPYLLDRADIDSALPDFLPGHDLLSLSPRLFRLAVLLSQHIAMLEVSVAMPAIFFVCLGGLGMVGDWWGAPSQWPPIMGDPRAILQGGLRGFWGKFWHQLFRGVRFVHPPLMFVLTRKDLLGSRKSPDPNTEYQVKVNC